MGGSFPKGAVLVSSVNVYSPLFWFYYENLNDFVSVLSCQPGEPNQSVQPTRLWTGVPRAHLPAHREDRTATGTQPSTTETDLWPAEGRQSDQD